MAEGDLLSLWADRRRADWALFDANDETSALPPASRIGDKASLVLSPMSLHISSVENGGLSSSAENPSLYS